MEDQYLLKFIAHDRVSLLLSKFFSSGLDQDEQALFDEWLHYADNTPWWNNFRNKEELTRNIKWLLDTNQRHDEYLKKLNAKIQSRKIVASNRSGINKRFLAIAASILICICLTSVWLWLRPGSDDEAESLVQSREITDISPADNKAVLRLSSGKTIVLNDMDNGLLTQDGKTLIKKKRDGELVYETTSAVSNPDLLYNTISTPRGGKYQVALPDGSKVWLNAATELSFPVAFTNMERHVELSGEAYFEVAKDATKPFRLTVKSGSGVLQEIEVLGTHFNVGAYQDEPVTNATLLEGSIRVSLNVKSKKVLSRNLLPGQRVIARRSSGDFSIATPENPESAIAWVNGKFSFEKSDLASVMRELSRWYDIDILFEGISPENKLITGKIDRNMPLLKLLSNLEKMVNVRFQIKGRTVLAKP